MSSLLKEQNLDILGLLETKLDEITLRSILHYKFRGWNQINNFDTHVAGRILVLSNTAIVCLEVLAIFPQVIHFKATCKVSSIPVHLSFIYGLQTIIDRRPLWDNLLDFSLHSHSPWLLLGDFNNALSSLNRHNGADVTPYEIRDFEVFCFGSGVSDLQYTDSHFTWTNDSVWSKIDRAMCNYHWFAADHYIHVNFGRWDCSQIIQLALL